MLEAMRNQFREKLINDYMFIEDLSRKSLLREVAFAESDLTRGVCSMGVVLQEG